MSPRWQRIVISGGIAIAVGAVAVPAVIAYALVHDNSDGSEAEIARITPTTAVSPTAMPTPRAAPSPTLSAITLEPTPDSGPEPTPEARMATAPIEEAIPAPQEETPVPTSSPPSPPTPTFLPVSSSIFVGPGVLFELGDAEIDGLTVTVQGTVCSRDFKIARIAWNWGDGTVEEGWFPARHTYAEPGQYMLSVLVYDDHGTVIAGQSSSLDMEQ